jgi:hypothetical protein
MLCNGTAFAVLQSRGADPTLLTKDTEPYLSPGRKGVLDVAVDDEEVRRQLAALNAKYEGEQLSDVKFDCMHMLSNLRWHLQAVCAATALCFVTELGVTFLGRAGCGSGR